MCNCHMAGFCTFVTFPLTPCACLLEGWSLIHTFNPIKGKIMTSFSKSKQAVEEFSTSLCYINKESPNCC